MAYISCLGYVVKVTAAKVTIEEPELSQWNEYSCFECLLLIDVVKLL
jgi:hypothetical protein